MTIVAAEPVRTRVITVVSDLPDDAWDAYVDAHPDATAYHLSAWPRLIARVFRRDIRLLAATSDGQVTGVLPLIGFRSRLFGTFAVSLPFVNYGGVLADDPSSAHALLEAAADVAGRWKASHVELRHWQQQFPDLRARRHKVAMTLPLRESVEAQWQALDRKIRNQVRKAEKSGITVTVGGVDLVPAFYKVFSRNMRDLGTPVYPIRFFREMLTAFPDRTHVFLAEAEGRPVAAAVTQSFRQVFEVPSASAYREFRTLCPNVLMYWEMLRFAVASGARVFDFGRSTLGEGTYHFKRQWGAESHELVWEYWTSGRKRLPDLSPANPRYRQAIAIWQRLPVSLANRVGPRIVRNLP